jgi:hypothetical protein
MMTRGLQVMSCVYFVAVSSMHAWPLNTWPKWPPPPGGAAPPPGGQRPPLRFPNFL